MSAYRTKHDTLARLAAEREVFTRRQLAECGFSDGAVARALAQRRLFRIFRGVYSLSPKVSPVGRMLAATLSTNGAATSFTAAYLYGLTKRPPTVVDVATTSPRASQEGIRLHRTRSLKARDAQGVAAVPPIKVLAALAATGLTDRDFTRIVNEALVQNLVTEEQLVVSRCRRLSDLVASGRAQRTRSTFEDDFAAFLYHHDVPTPIFNAQIHGDEVDAYWPEHHLVAELDGAKYHGTTIRKRWDREKQARLESLRLRVIRVEKLDPALASRLASATASHSRAA